MYWAGYSYGNREIVMKRILAKHDNDLASHAIEGREFYRSKTERRHTVKTDKATWFREMGATAVMMIPTTTNSALAKRLREVVVMNPGPRGTTLKIIESPVGL